MGGRLRALDGLRVVSVGAVMLAGYNWLLPCGWIGVLVFYVLSGFLITRILLDERAQARSGFQYFGRFYFRRTLRIFPLYFAYLFALDLIYLRWGVHASWPQVRPWAFGYAVNIGMATGAVDARPAYGHLWTLSVEEQFYLVWPLVVWFLSRTALLRTVLALIALGPLVRYAAVKWLGLSTGQLYVSSFTHLDAFAAGALLAVRELPLRRVWPFALGAIAFTFAIGIEAVWMTGMSKRFLGYPEGLYEASAHVWGYTLLNLTSALVILTALRGELDWLGRQPLAYLGKISYGIYLFQRPVIALYGAWLEPRVIAALPSAKLALLLGFAICVAAAVGLAAISYHLFEAPILRWRDRKVSARKSRALTAAPAPARTVAAPDAATLPPP